MSNVQFMTQTRTKLSTTLLKNDHHANSAFAITANHMAKRNESDHGCAGGTLVNISAGGCYSPLEVIYQARFSVIENPSNNVTINILSQGANKKIVKSFHSNMFMALCLEILCLSTVPAVRRDYL
ncbi:uncharacterized protein BJ212DRAFT_1295734 [Suillus subaureus]|uniref:Uncharacterized protein n=1 Tax=Suillus subaureus TaxID=48587 RepID=A0A9P7EKG0_9AGAM|nr:uncharacterized protein BJ212DRAFT_1295734 [Suillus subaureus]KAG1824601.1 hypothetical protein BJ212DRAFT_1295734 [Suillus subaureus]